ncbi:MULTISPECIES: hypothetical protein [unclassified Okeania]|nr:MULTISPECIES: hypothetical protein [unclassified Okeania]
MKKESGRGAVGLVTYRSHKNVVYGDSNPSNRICTTGDDGLLNP